MRSLSYVNTFKHKAECRKSKTLHRHKNTALKIFSVVILRTFFLSELLELYLLAMLATVFLSLYVFSHTMMLWKKWQCWKIIPQLIWLLKSLVLMQLYIHISDKIYAVQNCFRFWNKLFFKKFFHPLLLWFYICLCQFSHDR